MRFSPGASLGPFEIQAPIGAGGMGEVYRARDTRLDRTVAIKLLPSELVAGPSRRAERFRSEARAIARITHPNICTLHDVGEDGSSIYLVMEYVEGETLARRLEDGPLPLPLALRTAIAIADALDHAHRHGVVHRDVKPGNIILSRDGVKLLDFGLAKLREPDESPAAAETQSAGLTDVGMIVGTLPYMAPEQIDGSDVDGRTDIFSFGVVLFEMVGGRRPFAGNSRASLLSAVLTADPPALTSLQPQAPEALERLVRRCLAKNPDDRWQTARDVAAELRWIADTGSGTTVTSRTAASRWTGRAAIAGGGVGAGLLAAAVFAAAWPSNAVTPAVEFQPVTYRNGVVTAARFTPDGRSFVYSASWEGQPFGAFLGRPEGPDARDLQLPEARIRSISRTGDMAVVFGPQTIERSFGERTLARIPMAGGARRDLLTAIMDADWIPGTETLAVIRDPGGNRPWRVEFPAGTMVHEAPAVWSLRVSPDGSRVAFFEGPVLFDGQATSKVTIVDRAGRKTTVATEVSGYGLAWPPTGTEVWFTAAGRGAGVGPQLTAASLSGVQRAVHRTPDWMVLHDIAPDGTVLVSRNTIRVEMKCKPPGEEPERDLTWLIGSYVTGLSPDGQTAIFSEPLGSNTPGEQPLYRRSLDGAPAVAIGQGRGAGLSPDGRWLVTWSDNGLVLLPMGAGTAVRLPRGDLARVGNVSWLGDSTRIVFSGDTGNGVPRGYVQEIPAGVPRAFTPEGVALARAAARGDGTVLARVGPQWKLFPVDGGEGRPAPGLVPRDLPMQWSPDGRYLYTSTAFDPARARPRALEVFRVDLATGQRTVWKTLSPADPVGAQMMPANVAITPDGNGYCYSAMRRLGDLFVATGLR
jgi:eukaryotic-like serine/threonine-protein kinase